METIGTVGLIGIIAGAASIILATIAIWQAMYFYSKGKDTESRVETSLVGIKSQVDTLQAVNSKITDRLTKFVTTPRTDAAQSVELLSMTLRTLPELALKFLPPSQTTNETTMRKEITLCYVAIWYYVATTNFWASLCLPFPEQFDQEKDALVKRIVDQSAADFKYMHNLVSQLDEAEIQRQDFQYAHLYNEVTQYLLPLVADTSEHFARMAKTI